MVALLSTNLEPVDHNSVVRTLCVAITAGAIVALGIAFFGLGFRADLTTTRALIFLVVKVAFAIGVAGLSLAYLTRLARPAGNEKSRPSWSLHRFSSLWFLPQSALGPRPARIGKG
jgi:hypothetical protein